MKVVAVFVNPVLFAFSFSLAMGHTAFTTLADRAVHVLGQFQHFNQICKLLHGSFQGYSTPNNELETLKNFLVEGFGN